MMKYIEIAKRHDNYSQYKHRGITVYITKMERIRQDDGLPYAENLYEIENDAGEYHVFHKAEDANRFINKDLAYKKKEAENNERRYG